MYNYCKYLYIWHNHHNLKTIMPLSRREVVEILLVAQISHSTSMGLVYFPTSTIEIHYMNLLWAPPNLHFSRVFIVNNLVYKGGQNLYFSMASGGESRWKSLPPLTSAARSVFRRSGFRPKKQWIRGNPKTGIQAYNIQNSKNTYIFQKQITAHWSDPFFGDWWITIWVRQVCRNLIMLMNSLQKRPTPFFNCVLVGTCTLKNWCPVHSDLLHTFTNIKLVVGVAEHFQDEW